MELNNKTIWDNVLTKIELSISKANFKTWFQETDLKEVTKEGVAIITVPNQFVKNWLGEKFNQLIVKNLKDTEPMIKKVEYLIEKKNLKY